MLSDAGFAPDRPTGLRHLAGLAAQHSLIGPDAVRVIEGMTVLRNLAAHGGARDLSTERAPEYLALADTVLFPRGASEPTRPLTATEVLVAQLRGRRRDDPPENRTSARLPLRRTSDETRSDRPSVGSEGQRWQPYDDVESSHRDGHHSAEQVEDVRGVVVLDGPVVGVVADAGLVAGSDPVRLHHPPDG